MINLYNEIEDADTSEFTAAKKVNLEKPLVIDEDKIHKLFIAHGTGMGAGIGAFRENKPDDKYKTQLITEAHGEDELKIALVKLAENLELDIEIKEK